MRQTIERIRGALPPSSIISKTTPLKNKSIGEFLGLCPFHNEKTPSFTVSDIKGFYHCFGCGEHGDIFTFVMKQNNLDYKGAIEMLAREAGVELPRLNKREIDEEQKYKALKNIFERVTTYYHNTLFTREGKVGLEYFESRGLDKSTIEHFRLGYAPENQGELINMLLKHYPKSAINDSGVLGKPGTDNLFNMFRGRVIFPIMNREGRTIAFGGRSINGAEPKYLNSAENLQFKKGHELFALGSAIGNASKEASIVLVEGYMDVISLYQKGIKNAVAPLGTAAKLEQIKLLWNYAAEPVICMDGDLAGRNSAKKIAYTAFPELIPGKTLRFVALDSVKDPDEAVTKYGKSYFISLIQSSKNLSDFIFDLEVKNLPSKAPEHLANLKGRLSALAEQVKSADLQKQYKSFFNDRFYAEFIRKDNKKRKNKYSIDEAAIVSSTMGIKDHNIVCILEAFILYPSLLVQESLKEKLSSLEIKSKKLDNIRNKLLFISELNGDDLVKQSLEKLKEDIVNSSEQFFITSVFDSKERFANDDQVLRLERLFDLVALDDLDEKLQILSEKMIAEPTEEIFNKLTAIKELQDKLKLNLGIT